MLAAVRKEQPDVRPGQTLVHQALLRWAAASLRQHRLFPASLERPHARPAPPRPPRPQDTGVFNQKVESKNMQEQMMTNPDMMQGMMKAQMGGVLPQVGGLGGRSVGSTGRPGLRRQRQPPCCPALA